MAIPYGEQGGIVADAGFRSKVEAGCQVIALQVTAPPISGSAQRVALGNAVIDDSLFAVTQFCWAIAGKPQVNDIGQITDQQINTAILQYWDQIAAAKLPGP